MKSKLFRYTSLFVGILLLAGLFLGAMTTRSAAVTPPVPQADTDTQADGNMSSLQAPGWTAATRPWSPERMAAAKPYPVKMPTGERALDIAPAAAEGLPGLKPSGLPMNSRPVAGPNVDLEMGVVSSPSPLGYSYPAPFTRYNHFQSYVTFPYVTVGKLFLTQYGIDYVCSASSIGNYAIWTAGHCVHAGDGSSGGWSYDVMFVPGYRNGAAPKGVWYAYNLWVRTAWATSEDYRQDMGGAILYTNGSGLRISQVVGNLGFAYNQSRNLHWFQLGYPQAAPFNGKWMAINASSFAYNDTSMGSPYPVGVGSDLTGGSSGGPWIYKFSGSAGASNYVNGHNDYRYTGYTKEMFSPFFGDAAYSLWNSLVTDTAP